LIAAATLLGSTRTGPDAFAGNFPAECEVDRVIDGDTFVCLGGPTVRMLQINAAEKNTCGGGWATAALGTIFLPTGTRVRLQYDAVRTDRYGRTLAAPIVRGTDGADYNISIVMVYVGLAKAAYYGDNAALLDWANASETWARNAQWNMWAPGGPYNGATNCGDPGPF
jgi:endonuclease YncB( thermonuclease family)